MAPAPMDSALGASRRAAIPEARVSVSHPAVSRKAKKCRGRLPVANHACCITVTITLPMNSTQTNRIPMLQIGGRVGEHGLGVGDHDPVAAP